MNDPGVQLALLVKRLPYGPNMFASSMEDTFPSVYYQINILASKILADQYDPWFDVNENYPEIRMAKMQAFVERLK